MRRSTAVVVLGVGVALLLGAETGAHGVEQIAAVPAFRAAPVIEIWKELRKMELRVGKEVVRDFRVVLGPAPRMAKEKQGDGRTPVGRYYVSDKLPASRFRRFLGISYPNPDDAERGYASRLINANEWADIFFANLRGSIPSWRTALGGRVGIHGFGGRPLVPIDWTEGCVAVSDEEIDFLYERVPVGTTVIINE